MGFGFFFVLRATAAYEPEGSIGREDDGGIVDGSEVG
jgi:hypothetical protein